MGLIWWKTSHRVTSLPPYLFWTTKNREIHNHFQASTRPSGHVSADLQRGSSRQSMGAPSGAPEPRAPPPVPPPPVTSQTSVTAVSPTEDSSGRLSATDPTSSTTQGGSPNAQRRDSQGLNLFSWCSLTFPLIKLRYKSK